MLTIAILGWVWGAIQQNVLAPVKDGVRQAFVWWHGSDIRVEPTGGGKPREMIDGETYVRLESGQYIPAEVHDWLREHLPAERMPATGDAAFRRYIKAQYLQPQVIVPVFLLVFILLLYVLGKFLAAELNHFFEWSLHRLPLIRTVYASVKKVTDFVFVERQVQYKRVVAIEYPRPGVWSIGLVTGEGMSDLHPENGEPCLTVALPGSPVPVTGYCVTVPRSQAHDLNLSVDQALQFIVSCGVVVPPHQVPNSSADRREV